MSLLPAPSVILFLVLTLGFLKHMRSTMFTMLHCSEK